jgi:hypothetical protein
MTKAPAYARVLATDPFATIERAVMTKAMSRMLMCRCARVKEVKKYILRFSNPTFTGSREERERVKEDARCSE